MVSSYSLFLMTKYRVAKHAVRILQLPSLVLGRVEEGLVLLPSLGLCRSKEEHDTGHVDHYDALCQDAGWGCGKFPLPGIFPLPCHTAYLYTPPPPDPLHLWGLSIPFSLAFPYLLPSP